MPTAPTLVTYAQTTWTRQTATPNNKDTSSGGQDSGGTITWQAGDFIVAIGGSELAASTTLSTPTATGLTFAAWGTNPVGAGNQCLVYTWSATASGSGSSKVTIGCSQTSNRAFGIGVWVFRGSDGQGNRASAAGGSASTLSLSRTYDNSKVAAGLFDYNVASTGTAWAPVAGATGRELAQEDGAQSYSVAVADWDDQGTAGSTSYGRSGWGTSPTPVFTNVALEIRGGAGSPVTADAGPAAAAATAPADAGQAGTGWLYAGAASGVSGSWADTANAVGSGTGDYATWTDSGSGTSAVLELSTFGAQAAVPAGATVDSVAVRVRHSEDPAAQLASVTAQAYLATTPYGSPQALTVSATVHEDTVTVGGLTRTDLADLRIRVTATRVT